MIYAVYRKTDKEVNMRGMVKVLAPVVLVSFILAGCGGRVSETRPIDGVRAEAESMNAAQLQVMVDKYKKVMEAKKQDLVKLNEKLKSIPIREVMGTEAKKIKADIETCARSIKALGERLNVYVRELSRNQ